MIIEKCIRTDRWFAFQKIAGQPCLGDGETRNEARDNCAFLIGEVAISRELKYHDVMRSYRWER
jgi:hypothetical protein